MLKHKKLLLLLSNFLLSIGVFAQQMNTFSEEPTDFMNSNGKIFVVVAVVVLILIGLFIYLINLDRKIKKLENEKSIKK